MMTDSAIVCFLLVVKFLRTNLHSEEHNEGEHCSAGENTSLHVLLPATQKRSLLNMLRKMLLLDVSQMEGLENSYPI